MFKKIKEKQKVNKFEELKKQFELNGKVYDFKSELFLNYLVKEMQGCMVQITYKFGIIQMKKQINGERVVMHYPLVEIEEWTVDLKSSRCSVESTKNEIQLVVETDWAIPSPEQIVVITFSK